MVKRVNCFSKSEIGEIGEVNACLFPTNTKPMMITKICKYAIFKNIFGCLIKDGTFILALFAILITG